MSIDTVARQIAAALLKDGSGRDHRRLVLEQLNEFTGHAGYTEGGLVSTIERVLSRSCAQAQRKTKRKRRPLGRRSSPARSRRAR